MKLKNNITIILLIVAMLIGLSLLLYPTVSNLWNEKHQAQVIAAYEQDVKNLNEEQYKKILEEAVVYNNELAWRAQKYVMSDKEKEAYNNLLRVGDTGIMGYVDIPMINCRLPIYHGSDSSVLQVGIGHLEWTSLPVGGESSHCVLIGHRGLPNAKLFTNLDKLAQGDTFTLNVLDEVLTYEVDQISVVEPNEIENLKIVNGKDYCTLVTCTPYGVNTHRLLVRGVRTDDSGWRISADAEQISALLIAAIIVIPIFIALTSVLVINDKRKKMYIRLRREIK